MKDNAANAATGNRIVAAADAAGATDAAATTQCRGRFFSALRVQRGAGGKEFGRIGGVMIVARVA